MSQPLAGRRILVTRPREQAEPLAQALREHGAEALVFPAMVIAPLEDQAPRRAALKRLAKFDYAAFVSANAVKFGLEGLAVWPMRVLALAPGPGTAKALRKHGARRILVPRERFDTEGLLELPQLQSPAGRRVMIFRGDGGRELLAEGLRERGAEVELVCCYRRLPPISELPGMEQALREQPIDAAVFTSSEGLNNILQGLPAESAKQLRALPVFVPHSRIAVRAAQLGCGNVIVTAGADAGVLQGLLDHFRPT